MTNEEIHEAARGHIPSSIHDGPVQAIKQNTKRYHFMQGAQWAAERMFTETQLSEAMLEVIEICAAHTEDGCMDKECAQANSEAYIKRLKERKKK